MSTGGLRIRIFASIFLMGVAVALSGCSKDVSKTQSVNLSSTPSRVQILIEKLDPRNSDSSLVFLNDVHLEPAPGGKSWIAVGPQGFRVFVIFRQPLHDPESLPETVDLFATIHVKPTIQFGKHVMKLDKETTAEMVGQGFYLDEASIQYEERQD